MNQIRNRYAEYVPQKALEYLSKLDDAAQYLAARCEMGDGICMYGTSASSGLESMNQANMCAHQQSTVDIINGTLLLIEMEHSRFIKKQKTAWSSNEILTVKGRVKMQDCFESINVGNWNLPITPHLP